MSIPIESPSSPNGFLFSSPIMAPILLNGQPPYHHDYGNITPSTPNNGSNQSLNILSSTPNTPNSVSSTPSNNPSPLNNNVSTMQAIWNQEFILYVLNNIL